MKNFIIGIFILSSTMIFGMNNSFQQKAIEDARRQAAFQAQLTLNLAKATNSPVPSQVGIGTNAQVQHAIHQHNLNVANAKK